MKNIDTKKVAKILENISNSVMQEKLIPLVTKSGILIGMFVIVPSNGMFQVKKGKEVLYTTYTKTAAMIIAQLLSTKTKPNVLDILEADRVMSAAKNDLEFFKYNFEKASDEKREILLSKFDAADDRYYTAREKLQRSYYSLF